MLTNPSISKIESFFEQNKHALEFHISTCLFNTDNRQYICGPTGPTGCISPTCPATSKNPEQKSQVEQVKKASPFQSGFTLMVRINQNHEKCFAELTNLMNGLGDHEVQMQPHTYEYTSRGNIKPECEQLYQNAQKTKQEIQTKVSTILKKIDPILEELRSTGVHLADYEGNPIENSDGYLGWGWSFPEECDDKNEWYNWNTTYDYYMDILFHPGTPFFQWIVGFDPISALIKQKM